MHQDKLLVVIVVSVTVVVFAGIHYDARVQTHRQTAQAAENSAASAVEPVQADFAKVVACVPSQGQLTARIGESDQRDVWTKNGNLVQIQRLWDDGLTPYSPTVIEVEGGLRRFGIKHPGGVDWLMGMPESFPQDLKWALAACAKK